MALLPLRCVAANPARSGLLCVLAPLAFLAAGAAAQEQHTPAVLKLQEADFFYRSRIAPFTCGDLQRRVASILSALGARNDVEVRASGCDAVLEPMATVETPESGSGRWGTPGNRWQTAADPFARNQHGTREQNVHVRVRMMMPVEVTPEVLAEMEKDKSRRELISRVTGNANASFNDPIVFPAERREVTLSRRTVDLESDECELLEQMASGIFRELDIRVVQGARRCDRDSLSHMPPQIVVEALMPIMPSAPQLAPAASESQGEEAASDEEPASGEPSDDASATPAETRPE